MSEPILNVMKIMLLAALYLFFIRVLWSVYNEIRDPRTAVRKPGPGVVEGDSSARSTVRRPSKAPATAAAFAPSGLANPLRSDAVAVSAEPIVGQLRISEPQHLAGVVYRLGTEITIGRATTNGIVLDDTYVSTVHARIFATNGSYFVEDLASRNGSSINGAAIVATTALLPGDTITIGATMLEFT